MPDALVAGNQAAVVALQYLHSGDIANFTLSSGEVRGLAEVTGHMEETVLGGWGVGVAQQGFDFSRAEMAGVDAEDVRANHATVACYIYSLGVTH